MVDGSPEALLVPTQFVQFLQAPEDYYFKSFIGSYTRIFRFLAFFIAISFPALYVALLSFQPELIPVNLLIPLAQARKEVPYPVIVETLLQEGIIQLVIESVCVCPAR